MRIGTITMVIALSLCATEIFGLAQKTPLDSKNKPVVTLMISSEEYDVVRKDGRTYFVIDASASEGFDGTVSGTISVSEPQNPDQVELIEGTDSKEFPFKLAAGQKMSDTQLDEIRRFRVWTSRTNPTKGTIAWAVTLNPSTQYTTAKSPIFTRVRVG